MLVARLLLDPGRSNWCVSGADIVQTACGCPCSLAIVEERRIAVEVGQVVADESWVYVWLDSRGEVLYVGGTRLPVEVRTWLRLTSVDPQIGRVLAQHPEALVGRVDVRAWRLPPGVDRQSVRDALSAELIASSDVTANLDSAGAAATETILARLRA